MTECKNGSRVKSALNNEEDYPPSLVITNADRNIGSWSEARELLFDSDGNARFTNDLTDFFESQGLDASFQHYLADPFYVCRRPPQAIISEATASLNSIETGLVGRIIWAYWNTYCECIPDSGRCPGVQYEIRWFIDWGGGFSPSKTPGHDVGEWQSSQYFGPLGTPFFRLRPGGFSDSYTLYLPCHDHLGNPVERIVASRFVSQTGGGSALTLVEWDVRRQDLLPDECEPAPPPVPPPGVEPEFWNIPYGEEPVIIVIPGDCPCPPPICPCEPNINIDIPDIPDIGPITINLPSIPDLTINLPDIPDLPDFDINFPQEDEVIQGSFYLQRCDGGQQLYQYSDLNTFGAAMSGAIAAMAQDNCLLLNGEVVLPECQEPDEEQVNIFLDIVVNIISGQIVDVIIATLGRAGVQGFVAALLLQIVGEILAIALSDFFRAFLPQGTPEPTTLQWQGRGLKGLSEQIDALNRQMEAIGDILCQEDVPEDPGEASDPSCNAVVLLPAEPLNELEVPTQLVIKFGLNYPSSAGSRWTIHVPYPIPDLNWCDHFENLFRTVVDSDAELRWVARQYWADSRLWTGGYFASRDEAAGFLDQMVGLSQAAPGKRTLTERNKPNGVAMAASIRSVRAVRAVVSTIDNSSGRPIIENIQCFAPPQGGCN
jgi:hypothetical protein